MQPRDIKRTVNVTDYHNSRRAIGPIESRIMLDQTPDQHDQVFNWPDARDDAEGIQTEVLWRSN